MAEPGVCKGADGTLAFSGQLVFANAAATLEAARPLVRDPAVQRLDLAEVTMVDSAGMACLLATMAAARRQNGRQLQVANVPEGLRALARVCEVTPLLSATA